MTEKAKISEIAGHIRAANGAVTFIVGAGASRSAGIPMAKELVAQIEEKFPHCCNSLHGFDRQHYGKMMSALSPAEREQLISPLLRDAKVNWGHVALATLLRGKLVQRVLTFNFDLILESAASMLGVHVPVYDFGVAPTRDINRVVKPSIVHLHGQSHGMVLLNTEEETKSHCETIRPVLADALRSSLTVVCGYSGEADAAFKIIEREYNDYNRLIWCGYGSKAPSHLQKILKNRYAEYIGECDFDRTLLEIAKELGVWPPKILESPMHHVLEVLGATTNFPVGKNTGEDFLIEIRRRLEVFAKQWKGETTADSRVFDLALGVTTSGDGDKTDFLRLSEKAKTALAWRRVEEADKISDEARLVAGSAARIKYSQAYEKYEEAIAIDPSLHEAIFNWGCTLLDEAKTLGGDEAHLKFDEACKKFEAFLATGRDNYKAYFSWGTALIEEAKTMAAAEAISKFLEASEKIAAAESCEPNKPEVVDARGTVLMEEAKALEGAAADEKFEDAQKKLEYHRQINGRPSYNLACLYALRGQSESAIDILEICNDEGVLPSLRHLDADTDLDAIRHHPRYIELHQRIAREAP